MAFSVTSKFGLPQWSAGSDGPTRQQFNTAFANLEARALAFSQESVRPAAGAVGRMHRNPTTGRVTVDGGGYWAKFGAWFQNEPYDPSSATVGIQQIPGQTGDLLSLLNTAGNQVGRVTVGGAAVFNGNVDAPNIAGGGLRFFANPDIRFVDHPGGIFLSNCNLLGTYGGLFSVVIGGAGIQIFVGYGASITATRTWHPDGSGNWGPWRTY